jgi:hypothetical protein
MTNSYGEPFPAYEDMLRAILKDNPHREVKGAETVALADCVASTFDRVAIGVASSPAATAPQSVL